MACPTEEQSGASSYVMDYTGDLAQNPVPAGQRAAPGLLRRLQVDPRLILLQAVPVGKRRLAQHRTFGRVSDRVLLRIVTSTRRGSAR